MLLNRRVQLAAGLTAALLLLALVGSRTRLAEGMLVRRPAGARDTVVPAKSYHPEVEDWDEWPSGNGTVSPQRSDIRAAFVVLARNSDLSGILQSMRQLEDRFNRRFHYPWIFSASNGQSTPLTT